MELLFWPVFCLLFSYMQGVLMPAIRRTPPGPEADRQAFALHWVGTAAYFLPAVLPLKVGVLVHFGSLNATSFVLAFLFRIILFDVGLNIGAKDPLFAVGKKALWDKALRKLAPANPARLNALLKLVALLVLVGLLLYVRG